METERSTIVKVGSSSLFDINSKEIKKDTFTNIANQLNKISNGVLVSSGGFLLGENEGIKGAPSVVSSAGWIEIMNHWNEAFGSIQPQLLATEKDFHPLSKVELFLNFLNKIAQKEPIYEKRFEIITENLKDIWKHGKTLITNQQDILSRLGLAPDIIHFSPTGKVEFHGDNDLYSATISIQLLTHNITDAVSLLILSGDKLGILDDKGKTIPTETAEGLRQRISENTETSRENSNGSMTKFNALATAAEHGVDTYLGSANDSTAALQASTGKVGGGVTKIVDHTTEV